MLSSLRRVHGVGAPFLVVAPLATLTHWQREVNAWTTLDGVVYHGNKEARELFVAHEWRRGASLRRPKFDVVVTSYEMLTATTELFRKAPRCTRDCTRERCARRLPSRAPPVFAGRVGLLRDRRGASTQEPRGEGAHRPAVAACTVQARAHWHAAAEQRGRAVVDAPPARPAPLRRRRRLPAPVRRHALARAGAHLARPSPSLGDATGGRLTRASSSRWPR